MMEPFVIRGSRYCFRATTWQTNARAIAEKAGYYVVVDNSCDDWDYAHAARYLLDQFHALRRSYPRLCLISVGEVTVTLTENPGVGGRNQQFVLQCALELDRQPEERLTVLSAGSDGVDGNTQAAGAIADVTTVARAHALGYNAEATLTAFDACPLFTALGDLVVTKSTGQNLRDPRLLIAETSETRQGHAYTILCDVETRLRPTLSMRALGSDRRTIPSLANIIFHHRVKKAAR